MPDAAPEAEAPVPEGEVAPAPSSSVYELAEDEQLALAIQQSLLSDDDDPECTPGSGVVKSSPPPRATPSSSSAAANPADRSAGTAASPPSRAGPDGDPELTGAPPAAHLPGTPELCSPGVQQQSDCGAGPERTGPPAEQASASAARWAAPAPAPAPDEDAFDLASGPLAMRGAEGGAGCPSAAASPPARGAPPPERPSASTPARRPAEKGPDGKLPPEAEAQVRKALELAAARQFEDAERCLGEISEGLSGAREVLAAWEAVAMCKQFHAKK